MTYKRIGSVAVAVGVAAGSVGWLFAQGGPREEDRPAMIVRNGSIILQNETAKDQPAPPNWLYSDGLTFTTDQQNGKPVINADATVYNGTTITCELKAGLRFTIGYQEPGNSEEIHVIAAGQRPRVFPNDVLSRSTDKKQLTRGTKDKGTIVVWMENKKGKTCPVPRDHLLKITFNHPS